MNIRLLVESANTLAFFGLGGAELAVAGGIALLLFGNRLPGAAKSLGMSFTAFKKGIKEGEEELKDGDSESVDTPQPPEKIEK